MTDELSTSNSKAWYKSKTIWGEALLAIAGLITAVGQLLLGEINNETMLLSAGAFIKGIWGIYNRFKTNKSIE
jgi:hypothetical protein